MTDEIGTQDLSELNAEGRRMVQSAATISRLRSALMSQRCCRPPNDKPDEYTVGECVANDDCGCDCFLALRPGEMTPHERWEVQRQAESLAANDSRGERQAVLK